MQIFEVLRKIIKILYIFKMVFFEKFVNLEL